MGVSVTSNLFHASLSLLNLGKPVLNTDPGAATALLQQNCHSLSFSSPLFPSWTAGEQSPAQALLQPRNIQSLCCPQNLGASFKPRTSHLQSGARCPQTTTGTGTVLQARHGSHMAAASWGAQSCSVDVVSPAWPFCLIPNLCSAVLRVENQRQLFSWGWSWLNVEFCPWKERAGSPAPLDIVHRSLF